MQPNILETWNNEKFYWIYSVTSDKYDIRAAAGATEASPPFPYLLLTLTKSPQTHAERLETSQVWLSSQQHEHNEK